VPHKSVHQCASSLKREEGMNRARFACLVIAIGIGLFTGVLVAVAHGQTTNGQCCQFGGGTQAQYNQCNGCQLLSDGISSYYVTPTNEVNACDSSGHPEQNCQPTLQACYNGTWNVFGNTKCQGLPTGTKGVAQLVMQCSKDAPSCD